MSLEVFLIYCSVKSLGLIGIDAYVVSVEVDIKKGLPSFDIVGLPDASVKESRDRVRAALQNMGYAFPQGRVVVNLAPADTKKLGSVYDLPILVGLLGASGQSALDLADTALIGEISLGGEIRGVNGVLAMVLEAQRLGLRRIIIPSDNAAEGSTAKGVEVLAGKHVNQVIQALSGGDPLPGVTDEAVISPVSYYPDLLEVKGQSEAKRAMEVAAAGGHNLLFIGTPGTGKSMLAKRMPGILPPLSPAEAVETTKIHSVGGILPKNVSLMSSRPFRSPHHSVSPAGLTGGGSDPKPGEISLAHNGVLFLDEMPEFSRFCLEVLRQPLEDGQVTISRARQRLTFPAKFTLVGAMNPCPCGYFGHPSKQCSCTPAAISRYLNRISGPLLDRIDIHVEVLPVDYEQISSPDGGETSSQIADRVQKARRLQLERYEGHPITSNAMLTGALLNKYCNLTDSAQGLLKSAFERLSLSARGYDRILKVSRTIADLEGSDRIESPHILEAVQFRSLDRKYWNR